MVASYVRPSSPFILQSESQQTQISRNHLAHIMRNFTYLHSFDMNMWNVTLYTWTKTWNMSQSRWVYTVYTQSRENFMITFIVESPFKTTTNCVPDVPELQELLSREIFGRSLVFFSVFKVSEG